MRTFRRRGIALAIVALSLAAAGCSGYGSGGTGSSSGGREGPIVIGVSGAFTENEIVAEMYAQVLEHAGYTVQRQFNLPSRETSENALESGQIDLKPEYLSSLLLYLDPNARASNDPANVARQDRQLLQSRGITMLTPSRAQDTNEFVATLETARHYRLTTMSSLARVAGQLTMGGPAECPQRPYCLAGLKKVYGIVFDDFQPLDAGGPLTVAALKDGSVQIGLLFSTDPSIEQNDFVPLVDDKHLQNAENITPVIRSNDLNAQIRSLLDEVSAQLTTERVTHLIGRVLIHKQSVADVAQSFLTANGLL
jgi:osmoprotectant transport system substrate-binding protein